MRIRLAIPDDATALASIYAPYVRETVISFETEPPTSTEMAARIEAGAMIYPWLVATDRDVVVAYAYAGAHRARPAYRWSCDVTVYGAPAARRRGIGRMLYKQLNNVLIRQGFTNAFAGIALPNPASIGLHEALGFRKIGVYDNVGFKFGQWHSVGWWGLILQALDSNPPEPIPLSDIRGEIDRNLES